MTHASRVRHDAAPTSPATPARAAGRERRAPNKWVVLFTVVVMTFMSTLDSSIINVALPAMQRELAASASQIQLVSSAYLVALCVTVLVFGRLGDLYGKVRFFQLGVGVFTLGSLLCGLAQSLPVLVAARVVQGVGAASALATNMGIVTETFPSTERGRALGVVSTFVSLGLMCGPVLGGFLVAAFPWEAIFLVNVPIGAAALVVGLRTLPDDAPAADGREARPLDVAGALLMAPAVLALFCALNMAGSAPAPLVGAALAAGAALLVAFCAVERRAAFPLVRMSLFSNPVFSVNLLTMLLAFCAVGATEFLIPFFLQDACGFPSSVAGVLLTAIPLAMAVLGPVAGAASDRVGATGPCLAGLVVYAAGIFLVGSLPADAGPVRIYLTIAFMSVGTGLFQSPNNSLVMGSVEVCDLGFAGSVISLVRNMGMSVGVTGGSALLYGRMSALAGRPLASYVPGEPGLFLSGFSFAFGVLAAMVAAGAALTLAQAALARRRARRGAGDPSSVAEGARA